MKTLYLDIFSGISGDMFVGAMIDLGVDFQKLEQALAGLKLEGYHLHLSRQQRSGITGAKFDVHLTNEHQHGHEHSHATGGKHSHSHSHSHQHHDFILHGLTHSHSHAPGEIAADHEHEHGRNFADIKKLILDSNLSEWVKEKSIAVFHRIAVAEGKIHGHPPDEVHFHEVGAVDSIIDIIGGCICLEILGKPRVLAAPVVEGTGWVNCAHGRFPIPAAATLEILGAREIALTQSEEPHELVTPTGAALLAEFAESFAPMQQLIASKVGYGIGSRENKTRPNVLRAVLGESSNSKPKTQNLELSSNDWEIDSITVLETNLDDINSEILGAFVTRAFMEGALDVFHTPIQMKKNRPGVMLTVLCSSADADKFSEMILRETTAFGVRRTVSERRKLKREFCTVKTAFGEVSVKLGKLNGKTIQASPEFESCNAIAVKNDVPIKEVYAAALKVIDFDAK